MILFCEARIVGTVRFRAFSVSAIRPRWSNPAGLFPLEDTAIWQIVATEKTTGKRVHLATADNERERDMILREERKDKAYKKVEAVRVWN